MFQVTIDDINKILKDFGFMEQAASFDELQRYHYEKKDPASKEVRLIIKVKFDTHKPVVIRFKNEEDVTLELIEEQSNFAALLRQNGVEVPKQYKTQDHYARWYSICGYDVIVTIEAFAEGELLRVNEAIAFETGKLLARMHNISKTLDLHIKNDVLFDPFSCNDLFDFGEFKANEGILSQIDAPLYTDIVKTYEAYMEKLAPLSLEPGYAVQGDISNCNLYRTADGNLGVFDFNRAGDNRLYCDGIMQAVFEARLMDYPDNLGSDPEKVILPAFLKGYAQVRPFTHMQKALYPYLYAIIDTFWSQDIKWKEDSLVNVIQKGDVERIHQWLREIHRRIHQMRVWED